jgi:small GTP-binding protein
MPPKKKSYRSPIMTFASSSNSGKSSILDSIRSDKKTNSFSQTIGCTKILKNEINDNEDIVVPSIFMLDTPGNNIFSLMVKRCILLSDLTIIVLDITIEKIDDETLNIIKFCIDSNINIIFVLNKIENIDNIEKTELFLKLREIKDVKLSLVHFSKYKNKKNTYMYIPVSAKTDEGIKDLVLQSTLFCQKYLSKQLLQTNIFDSVILEYRQLDSNKKCLDIMMIDGELKSGDLIGFSTFTGFKTMIIENIYLPNSLEDISNTKNFKELSCVNGTECFRIITSKIENAIVGENIYKIENNIEPQINDSFNFKLDNIGIMLFASTFGQLEALFNLLHDKKIDIMISNVFIGNVKNSNIAKIQLFDLQYRYILCVDVETELDALNTISSNKIIVIRELNIELLCNLYLESLYELERKRILALREESRFPFELIVIDIKSDLFGVFNLFGVKIITGTISKNIQVCDEKGNNLGYIISIDNNYIKLENIENKIKLGTHIFPSLTRRSINLLFTYFKNELSYEMLNVISNIKRVQHVNKKLIIKKL